MARSSSANSSTALRACLPLMKTRLAAMRPSLMVDSGGAKKYRVGGPLRPRPPPTKNPVTLGISDDGLRVVGDGEASGALAISRSRCSLPSSHNHLDDDSAAARTEPSLFLMKLIQCSRIILVGLL